MHALELTNVSKSFGGIDAVSKVDLTVMMGESRALIGPNGAGKSTLFNLVTGEIPLDEGRILLFGKDLTREPVQKRIPSQLGRTYQTSNLFSQLTVQENLFLASWQTRTRKASLVATLFRSWRKFDNQRRYLTKIAHRVGLEDKLDTTVDACVLELLSGGPQSQAEIKSFFGQLEVGPVTEEIRELCAQTISRVRGTDEAREGFAAFLDKRPADWIPQ